MQRSWKTILKSFPILSTIKAVCDLTNGMLHMSHQRTLPLSRSPESHNGNVMGAFQPSLRHKRLFLSNPDVQQPSFDTCRNASDFNLFEDIFDQDSSSEANKGVVGVWEWQLLMWFSDRARVEFGLLLLLTKHLTRMERHLGETMIKRELKMEAILRSSFGQLVS